MPVTGGQREQDVSQRETYAAGGVGRTYWDLRDTAALSYVSGTVIRDIGCGEGITLEKIVKQFPDADVQGLDVDPTNIAICREHRLTVEPGSVYELPYDTASIDCCVFSEVIEHLDTPEVALQEIARVLRPQGRVIVIYPIDWAMFLARIICLKFKEAHFDPGHVRQWSRRALTTTLKDCGLQRIAARALPLPWPATLHGIVVGKKAP